MRTRARVHIWITVLCLLPTGEACHRSVPNAASVSEPWFEETEVYVGGQDNINTYRIPSVVCTRSGTVLVFSEGRRNSDEDGSLTDIVLKRSLGNAGPWSPLKQEGPVPARRGREHNMTWSPIQTPIVSKAGVAYMNPVPIIDESDGAIFLLVNLYPSPYRDVPEHVWMTKSTDEGASWSTLTDITAGTGLKELGPGNGIQMRSGRFVAPTYDGVIFSDDHGKTWESGGKAPVSGNETQVVELEDGSLMLILRRAPNPLSTVSKDGGRTWSPARTETALTDPKSFDGCQGSLIRYSLKKNGASKNRLLFSNPADRRYRFDMTVRVSYDEGKTWPAGKLIKKGPGAYSDLTVFPDGTMGLAYETGNTYGKTVEYYSKVSFARFNLEWLTDGNDHGERVR